MKIIIGLGNPDLKYAKTRHNIGFIMLDKLKKYFTDHNFNFENFVFDKNSHAKISKGITKSEKVLLVKPQTYMNNSGLSVVRLVNFYKIDPENDLIIIYDDIDLPFQEIRTKGKSSGGHKGMQSVINALGLDNLKRIRIGISGKGKRLAKDASSYVLKDFKPQEEKNLDKIFNKIIPVVEDFLKY